MSTLLVEQDYVDAAAKLGCEVAAIKAVAQVESSGAGFNEDGTPKILFEGQQFHRFTKGQFDASFPSLSYATWTRQFYAPNQQGEYVRYYTALKLNSLAAMLSTSWGKFQIMGFNFGACGFTSVDYFVAAMQVDEKAHLDAFVEFIVSRGLADELQDRRWADFARLYNGPGYAVNRYDTKLAAAYASFS